MSAVAYRQFGSVGRAQAFGCAGGVYILQAYIHANVENVLLYAHACLLVVVGAGASAACMALSYVCVLHCRLHLGCPAPLEPTPMCCAQRHC